MINLIEKLLYPYRCPFCKKIIKGGICDECKKKVTLIGDDFCLKCGKEIKGEREEFCADCKKNNNYFDAGRAAFVHKSPVSNALYDMKYNNERYIAKTFASIMFRMHGDIVNKWNPECIIPVPLSSKKMKKRGFNQAEELAKFFALDSGIYLDVDYVYRDKDTIPLKNLTPKERRINLENAFKVDSKKYDRVLLIDDIYTTGATVNAISKILKEKGTKEVYFLTASIGQGF